MAAEPVKPVRYRMFGRCVTSNASIPAASNRRDHARCARRNGHRSQVVERDGRHSADGCAAIHTLTACSANS